MQQVMLSNGDIIFYPNAMSPEEIEVRKEAIEQYISSKIFIQGRKERTDADEFFDQLQKAKQITHDYNQSISETYNAVNHPSHYNSLPAVCSACGDSIECIEVVRHMNFNLGNAMKYLWRAGEKNKDTEIQDLEKAVWYIEDQIEMLKRNRENEGSDS